MNENTIKEEKRKDALATMREGFVPLPARMLVEVGGKKLSALSLALYAYLLFRQGQNDCFWGSVKMMAKDLGISTSTVNRAINELLDNGYIERQKRSGQTWKTRCLCQVKRGKVTCDTFTTWRTTWREQPVEVASLDAEREDYASCSPEGFEFLDMLAAGRPKQSSGKRRFSVRAGTGMSLTRRRPLFFFNPHARLFRVQGSFLPLDAARLFHSDAAEQHKREGCTFGLPVCVEGCV